MMEDAFQKWCIEALPIVQAGVAGQMVQHKGCGVWSEKTGAGLGSNMSLYRIKPTPKYRPFTLEESGVLLNQRIIRTSEPHNLMTIFRVEVSHNGFEAFHRDGRCPGTLSRGYLVESCRFADTGKPCGVLVEGEE